VKGQLGPTGVGERQKGLWLCVDDQSPVFVGPTCAGEDSVNSIIVSSSFHPLHQPTAAIRQALFSSVAVPCHSHLKERCGFRNT